METTVFAQTLKELYKNRDKITQLIEGLDKIPEQSLEEYYVKLQVVARDEDNSRSKSATNSNRDLNLNKLFDGASNKSTSSKVAQRVLVLGEAGVGKSTLLKFMAYKCSIGKLWDERFDYVYLISLKSLLDKQWAYWPYKYEARDLNESRLRCLAHYSLMLSKDERRNITPKTLPWVGGDEDTSRILLLLNGFDEVAHLRNNSAYKDVFNQIFEQIFEFQNVILTSRPKAIENELRAKFNQLVENVGLNKDGVEEYLERYFKKETTKKRELLNFLDQNPIIKEICRVSINIAMIAYMWMCSESNLQLKEISNISILYQEMINLLSKRFLQKTEKSDPNDSAKVLEFKILSHAAYKALTGGGVDVEQNDRVTTLLIPGVVFKQDASTQPGGKIDFEDNDGISLQSSINYIEKLEKKEGSTSLKSLYKYGLLKAEGLISMSSKDPSDTDLRMQSYSFIHSTFQEYCAAYYLTYRLEKKDSKERSEIYRFIGEHRNEPRYAMILKFMAGIITSDQNEETQPVVEMFWRAISCNIDGVIEFGIETKAGLLLQLLGQANVEPLEIDQRIPNRQQIIDFIDVVVLKDIPAFYPQLEESGYMTENMKQGIIENLIDETQVWTISKMGEIAEKSQAVLKAAIKNIVAQMDKSEVTQSIKYRSIKIRRYIEITKKFLNKITERDIKEKYCEDILKRLLEACTKYTEKEAEIFELVLEKIDVLILNVNLENQVIKVIELIGLIISKAKGSNAFKITANLLKEIILRIGNSTLTCASEILNEVATLLMRIDFDITKILVSSLAKGPLAKKLKFEVIDNLILSGDKINMKKDLIKTLNMNKNEKFECFDKLISYLASQDPKSRACEIELISQFSLDSYKDVLAKFYGSAFEFYKDQGTVTKDVAINGFMCLTILFQENKLSQKIEETEDMDCGIPDEELIKETSKIISKVLNESSLSNLELDAKKIKNYLVLFAKKSSGYSVADQNQVFQNLDALLETDCAERNQVARAAYPKIVGIMNHSKEFLSQTLKKLRCFLKKDDKGLNKMAMEALEEITENATEEETKLEVFKELLTGLEKNCLRIDQVEKLLSQLLPNISDIELLRKTLYLALKLLPDKDEHVRLLASQTFRVASERMDDNETAKKCFESIKKLLKDRNDEVVKASMELLDAVFKMTKVKTREDLINRSIKFLMENKMSKDNYMATVIGTISRMVKLIEGYKDLFFERFSKDFVEFFKKDCTLRQDIKCILCELAKLRKEECLRSAFKLSQEFPKDQEEDSTTSLKYLFREITKKAHPRLAAGTVPFSIL